MVSAEALRPTTFCWRITPPGPAVRLALPFGEAVRAAVMRAGNGTGLARLPDAFHGGASGGPHDHAFWLAEDRDEDGHIDHGVVHAAAGIPHAVTAALVAVDSVHLAGGVTWSLSPEWMGRPLSGGLFGPARRWVAITAYFTPRWRIDRHGRERGGLDPDTQLLREIALRGLPTPGRVIWQNGGVVAEGPFATATASRRAPHGAWQGAPVLVFPEPVSGPLAFGFGAHFGLGLLKPAGVMQPIKLA